jgi:hypothetical protein
MKAEVVKGYWDRELLEAFSDMLKHEGLGQNKAGGR